ncbi:5814_t:CDS:2 [Ambispora gerdemannii]|uniref:5814_t:CDS:1 n=1 Tax=Ambispora gerdemannii TaxID=144530 RepID=A0A9N9D1E3_9GLOM|nr:5814_t:CDS:2 [Ambispora gerdemannii]
MDEATNLLVTTSPVAVSLSRTTRNGKVTGYKNYTSPLTEENLKLHTGMALPSREAKSHHVLSYVDLQKQLVALEAQLKRETEAVQERFNSALPENTPSVIPEIIYVPIKIPSPRSANFKTPQNHSLIKEKDSISIRLETSIPPSPAQSISVHSRGSSNRPLKRMFTYKPHLIVPPANPTSSVHNKPAHTPLLPSHLPIEPTSIIPPPRPTSPPANSNSFITATQQQQQRLAIVSTSPENRDSGISFVPPTGNHSRDQSFSLLRRVGNFSTFNLKEKENNNNNNNNNKSSNHHPQQTIKKKKSNSFPKNHEIELLAFRYPSVKKNNDLNTPMTNKDSDEATIIHYTALGDINVGSKSGSGFGIDSTWKSSSDSTNIAVAASNPIPVHIPTTRLQDDIDESLSNFTRFHNFKNINNDNKDHFNSTEVEKKFKEKESEWSASFDYDIIQSHVEEYDENGLQTKKKTSRFRVSSEKFSHYKNSNNSGRHNNLTSIDQLDILPTPAVVVE